VEAAKLLKARIGQAWTADRYQWLVQRWPDGIPPQDIDDIAAQLTGPALAKAQPLRVVGGQGGV
jgi:hypothetical protein